MDLVVLAAGAGARFGGPKQLARVGPEGEAIIDVLLGRAAAAGFGRAVVVVSDEIRADVRAHFLSRPPPVAVEIVVQPVPLSGTAYAVFVALRVARGAFAVVNADDLYPKEAFETLAAHLRDGARDEHALVAFPLAATLAGSRPVSRALLDVGADSRLLGIRETTVVPGPGGVPVEAEGRHEAVRGDAPVSMNMWGFRPAIADALARVVEEHARAGRRDEIFLPDVVATLLRAGEVVRVLRCDARCIGITYRDDVAVVAAALARG